MFGASNGAQCTELWVAAESGRADIISFLLQRGADVNAVKIPGGATPLFVAAQNGHTSALDALLQNGADPNLPREGGATPLFIAAQEGHTDCVQFLLQNGADPSRPNAHGVSPLMVAAFRGNAACVRLLLLGGGDAYAVGMGRNALNWADAGGHGDAVRELVESFAPNRSNSRSRRDHRNDSATGGSLPWHADERMPGTPIDVWEADREEIPSLPLADWATGRPLSHSLPSHARGACGGYEAQFLRRPKGGRSGGGSEAPSRGTLNVSSRAASVVQRKSNPTHASQDEGRRRRGSSVRSAARRSASTASRMRQLMERESIENVAFRTETSKSLFDVRTTQGKKAGQSGVLSAVSANETNARWSIFMRTLQERVREMELRKNNGSSGIMSCNGNDD